MTVDQREKLVKELERLLQKLPKLTYEEIGQRLSHFGLTLGRDGTYKNKVAGLANRLKKTTSAARPKDGCASINARLPPTSDDDWNKAAELRLKGKTYAEILAALPNAGLSTDKLFRRFRRDGIPTPPRVPVLYAKARAALAVGKKAKPLNVENMAAFRDAAPRAANGYFETAPGTECAWPIGNVRSKEFRFCCQPCLVKHPGAIPESYCPAHYAIAHVKDAA